MAENRPRNDGRPQPATDGERQPEASERYRALVENSSEGIWRLEFDPPLDTTLPVDAQVELAYRHGLLTECNDAMARMYGLERAGDLVGASLDSMLPSYDPAARAYIASIIEAGYRVSNVESTERDANGGIKHFANSMSGVVENGRLLRMWGTQRDITEQKQIERALRVSEARFRFMGDAAPVMIWTSGLDKGRTWFNAQWLQFVGRAGDREIGTGWVQSVHPDDVGRCLETYTVAFDERRPFTMEYRLQAARRGLSLGARHGRPPGRAGGLRRLTSAPVSTSPTASAKPRRVPTSRPSSNRPTMPSSRRISTASFVPATLPPSACSAIRLRSSSAGPYECSFRQTVSRKRI